jgi:hypothetical protein
LKKSKPVGRNLFAPTAVVAIYGHQDIGQAVISMSHDAERLRDRFAAALVANDASFGLLAHNTLARTELIWGVGNLVPNLVVTNSPGWARVNPGLVARRLAIPSRETFQISHRPPAVIAIASAPQKVTRAAPGKTAAPPAYAASAPKRARKVRDVTATRGTMSRAEAKMTHRSGMTAPTANAAAEAKAA